MQYFAIRRLKHDIYLKIFTRTFPSSEPPYSLCLSACERVSGVELAFSWTGEQQTGNKTVRCTYAAVAPETHDPPWVTSCTVWLIPSALHVDGPQKCAFLEGPQYSTTKAAVHEIVI